MNREFSTQVTESGLQLVPEPEDPEEHFADLNKKSNTIGQPYCEMSWMS